MLVDAVQRFPDALFRVDVDGAAHGDVDAPHIVEAEQVVHMVVRKEDGVGPPEVVAQGLGAKLRSGVAQDHAG